MTKRYGDIVSTSANGLNFVLWNKDTDQVSIIRINEKQAIFIKTIDLTKSIVEFLKRQEDNEMYSELWEEKGPKKNHWFYQARILKVDYQFLLNNFCDLLVQISYEG
jgi:hypothetical protein